MRMAIEKKRLDDKESGETQLECTVFAYVLHSDNDHPSYSFFSEEQGNLEATKSERFKVPVSAISIPHKVGGSHGDLRLRYKDANILLFPLRDYEKFFSKDAEFFNDCEVILAEQYTGETGFLKGNQKLLQKYGVSFV